MHARIEEEEEEEEEEDRRGKEGLSLLNDGKRGEREGVGEILCYYESLGRRRNLAKWVGFSGTR